MDVEKLECEDELTGTEISCLRLKGQMIYLPEADSILFLCSPRYFKPREFYNTRFHFTITNFKNTYESSMTETNWFEY